MSKLPHLKSREVVRMLKKHGFIEKRQVGSHLHLYHPLRQMRITIPMHNKDLKRKTLFSIFRQAKIKW
ncbi:hypothetical protein A2W24_04285 [Microgenomates group bacterium RBG_16_45_19]|nr:MAG: hypothetical protein A2W24_04285 [Microgenomates group bacterium RBG_16_45_19]